MGGKDATMGRLIRRYWGMKVGLVLAWIGSFAAWAQSNPPAADRVYDPRIQTVFLYPTAVESLRPDRTLASPVVSMRSNQSLVLEYDDMSFEGNQFYVKLFHYDAQWKPSNLREMEFLDSFNEFTIANYEVSQNTKASYHHYRFVVPRPRVSGNFMVAVYRDFRMKDPILTRMFYVLDPLVQIQGGVEPAQDGALWRTHQQLSLSVHWSGYNVAYNPAQDLKVYVRQNQRPDQIKGPFIPTQNIPHRQQLTYQLFRPEQLFSGGNEHRYIDLRSSFTRGYMVDKIQLGDPDELWMTPQASRAIGLYTDQRDFNGQFIIENRDQTNPNIACDYVTLHVDWQGEGPSSDRWFIRGAFNHWGWDQPLSWNPMAQRWTTELTLKQGVYDYLFSRIKADGTREDAPLEGNFADTENVYEVLVYHRPPGAQSDHLVGFARIPSRQR